MYTEDCNSNIILILLKMLKGLHKNIISVKSEFSLKGLTRSSIKHEE